jgi:hypothetical protein
VQIETLLHENPNPRVCLWDLKLFSVDTEHVDVLTPKIGTVVEDVVGFESQARNLLGVRIA